MTGDLSAHRVRAVLFGAHCHTPGSELHDLPAVDTTLDDLERTLLTVCGMNSAHVTRVTADADAPEVINAIEEATESADGPVLFYYVGHGLLGPGDALYLATHASRSNHHISQAVAYSTIRDILSDAPLGSLVILDCCFSGISSMPSANGGARGPFATARPRGSFLLTSASLYAPSFAPEGERHTLFSGRLLRLLNEGDPAGPPRLTADRLHAALDREFADDMRVSPARQSEGTLGSLVIARNRADRSDHAQAEMPEPPADLPCPYPGLQPFHAEDSAYFFGRKGLAARLVDAVEKEEDGSPVVLVGASGAGKSSLLRAGLLAHLEARRSAARPALLLPAPGAHPLRTLAEAWADATGRETDEVHAALEAGRFPGPLHGRQACRLLVVDQFEEVFTRCRDLRERAAFVGLLAGDHPGPRPRVVLGLRADHYGSCLDHPELERALAQPQITVPPLRERELRAAVEGPAAAVGLIVEPGLTDRLVQDLREGRSADDAAGAMPFLAHALRETWRRRSGVRLTLAGYQATGGIWHSVAVTAEALYDSLDESGQAMMRELLLRLVFLPPDGGEAVVRHQVPLAAVPEGAAEIREKLARARLLTVDQGTVQIAHESLLRAWHRLRQWTKEDTATLLLRQQLSTAAGEWDAAGRDAAYLYRGSRLQAALDLAERVEPPAVERQFLAAGQAVADRELRHDQRRVRVLRRALAGVAVALCLALVAAVLTVREQRKAEEQQRVAVARALLAEADNLSATDPRASLRLGLAAQALQPGAEARQTLFDTLSVNPFRGVSTLTDDGSGLINPALSADARTLAVAEGSSGDLMLWNTGRDPVPRTPLARLPCRPPSDREAGAAFGGPHDRTLVATCGADGVSVWDVAGLHRGGKPRRLAALRVDGLPGGPNAVAVSPDGGLLAAVGWSNNKVGQGVLVLWDIRDSRNPRRLSVVKSTPTQDMPSDRLTFSPDGRVLVTAGLSLRIWDVSDPSTPRAGGFVDEITKAVAFSPDGDLLATGNDRAVKLIDITSPRHPKMLEQRSAHTDTVGSLAFSADGRRLASGGSDADVILWDVGKPEDMTEDSRLTGHTYPVDAVTFGADGRSLVSVSSIAKEVAHWDLADVQQLDILKVIPRGRELALSPDGMLLAAARGIRIDLWNISDPAKPRSVTTLVDPGQDATLPAILSEPITDVAFNMDGTLLAGMTPDRRITLWDVTDPSHPRVAGTLQGNEGGLDPSLAFAPNAPLLAVNDREQVRVWDVRDPSHPAEKALSTNFARSLGGDISFSSDGRHVLVPGMSIALWDFPSGKDKTLSGQHRYFGGGVAAMSPDGDIVAAAAKLGSGSDSPASVQLWDAQDTAAPRMVGEMKVEGRQQAGKFTRLAFHPEGSLLAGAADDGAVRLWSVADPKQPYLAYTFQGHGDTVDDVVLGGPHGRTMITSSGGSAFIWDLGEYPQIAADLIGMACRVAGGGFTREQWAHQVPNAAFKETCPAR